MTKIGFVKIFVVSMILLLLTGCTKEVGSQSDQLTVSQLKEMYGDASNYNINTTTILLRGVEIESQVVSLNFEFESNRNISEFFNYGIYEHAYKATMEIYNNQDDLVYASDEFIIDTGSGNAPFTVDVSHQDALISLFNSEQILSIRLTVANQNGEQFSEYSFVGSGNGFLK